MSHGLLVVAMLPALLVSCALGPMSARHAQLSPGSPVAKPHAIPPIAALGGPPAPALAVPQAPSPTRLTLEQAQERAERLHPDLAAAGAQIEGAEGRALQAGLFPNPELVARTESAPVNGRLSKQAEYIVGVSQPLPLSRRLAVARRAETLDRDRLAHERELKRWEIRVRVHSAFATALYWQRVMQARAEDVRLAENGVAVANARLAAGDAIPAEVGQAEVEVSRAQLELQKATSMHAQAMEALVTAMGEPTLQVDSLEGSLEGPVAVPSVERLVARLEQSPTLAAMEADIAVRRTRLDLAKARRMPDVNLDLSYRRVSDDENTVDVGVRLPIPLFDRSQGRLQEAGADVAAAEARARAARHELTLELQTFYRTLAGAIGAAKLLREEILPRAERVLQSAEARYAAGDISLAELLPIRRDWTSARLDYLAALHEVMQAWAALSPYAW